MHLESNIQSLEPRRKLQLLKLMYHQSKNKENIKVANRPTRATEKVVFNIPSRGTNKFLASPYYLGTQIWNGLDGNIQQTNSMMEFERNILPLYKVYREPVI